MTHEALLAADGALRRGDLVAFVHAVNTAPADVLAAPLGSFKGTLLHAIIHAQRPPEWAAALLGRAPSLVNAQDSRGVTPLLSSLASGVPYPLPWMNALLTCGASVEAPSERGETPVHWAAVRADGGPLLARLFAQGATVDPLDQDGGTPLYHAVVCNVALGVVQALLDAGADPRRGKRSALARAEQAGNGPLLGRLRQQVVRLEQATLRTALPLAVAPEPVHGPSRRRL